MSLSGSFPQIVAQFPALAEFPQPLQELLAAELAAGNQIVEVSSCFPAPPAGAYAKLQGPVTTRPRESFAGVNFYDRNGSSYSGEFADERRFYFVLEPPRPPEPPPDMEAIRAEMRARELAADALLWQEQANFDRARELAHSYDRGDEEGGEVVDRFRASMDIDYEKWREGIGYDLSLLAEASPSQRSTIESLLLVRGAKDWRDVEALAALDSVRCRKVLREARYAMADGSTFSATAVRGGASGPASGPRPNYEIRLAALRYAPQLFSQEERLAILVEALEGADFYEGLTQALLEVQAYHPPAIVAALLRGALRRGGGVPVHFVAMLFYLYGLAESTFDWQHRPFFLQFNTQQPEERARLFRELCARIQVDPTPYLAGFPEPNELPWP